MNNKKVIDNYDPSKEYKNFIKKYPKLLILDCKLPENIKITTITSIYHYDCVFNVDYIADKLQLKKNLISSIKYGQELINNDDNNTKNIKPVKSTLKVNKTLIKSTKRRNNIVNNYRNYQVLHKNLLLQVRIGIDDRVNNIKFILKIFQNGTIQVTGSKNIISVFFIFDQLFKILREDQYLKEGKENLYVDKLQYFNTTLINCKTKFNYNVDRVKLYNILKKYYKNYIIKFDPTRHAAISIKYTDLIKDENIINKYKIRYTTIFIFEKGTILVNNGNCYKDLILSYKYIMNIIYNHPEVLIEKTGEIINKNSIKQLTKIDKNNWDDF
jgi:hypothetical protein